MTGLSHFDAKDFMVFLLFDTASFMEHYCDSWLFGGNGYILFYATDVVLLYTLLPRVFIVGFVMMPTLVLDMFLSGA